MPLTADEKIQKRIADAAPTKVIPSLIAMDDFRKSQRDYRQRVKDGHKASMAALGINVSDSEEEDEMGDIWVTGDITTTVPQPAQQQAIQPAVWHDSGTNWPAMVGTALGSSGLAAIAMMYALSGTPEVTQPEPPTIPSFENTDTQYNFGLGEPQ